VLSDAAAKTSRIASADAVLDTRLTYEAQLVLSRPPTTGELSVLRKFYRQALGMRKPAVVKANLNLSETSFGKRVPGEELGALTAVGSVLFNLDAALVR
jgi:hypothetical protein